MSEDDGDLIPVVLVKQYIFCPRIVYFSEVLGLKERETELMYEGRDMQWAEDRRDRRRKRVPGTGLEARGAKHGVLYVSRRLGLAGVVDLVVDEGGVAVVERKAAKRPKRVHRNHLYQLAAYALLVEEATGKPVMRAYIHYLKSGDIVEVTLTDEAKRHVLWIVRQIKSIIWEERLPPYSEKPACKSCGYRWICRQL
ncbi:CRISPR-associated exonuclease Cas4 [Candidatus Calditenuaceae archaeon HR02]|nr:CRISPR-associated exonuclease Cas4 [Candidatus Calditenuaceae archaeon HR02]